MTARLASIALWVSLTLAMCARDPSTPPTVYPGALVCAHLATIGCAQPAGCEKAYDDNAALVAGGFAGDCLMRASSSDAAARCGSVRCPPYRLHP